MAKSLFNTACHRFLAFESWINICGTFITSSKQVFPKHDANEIPSGAMAGKAKIISKYKDCKEFLKSAITEQIHVKQLTLHNTSGPKRFFSKKMFLLPF